MNSTRPAKPGPPPKAHVLRALIDRLFAGTFGYRYLRGFFHFGVRRAPLRRALALQPGDRVLDVGCGTGDYAPLVDRPDCSYEGLDFDEAYVATARRLYAAPYRRFLTGDLRAMAYPPGSFTKALLIGVMHHLNDAENLVLLRELNIVITDRLVVMDLSPGGWHVVNTALCRLDRGRFPRNLDDQCRLIGRVMDIVSADRYFVRSGIQRYSLIVARPRRGFPPA